MPRSIAEGPAGTAKTSHSEVSATALLGHWLGGRESTCALFLDVDGTLLDIATSPEAVFVPHELRGALESLHERLGGALALVSGRTVDNLDRLFAPLRLPASGGHGAQWRAWPDAALYSEVETGLVVPIRERLYSLAAKHAGVLVEDKGWSIALHYRAAPTAREPLAAALHELLNDPEAAGLRLLPGKMVFEVLPQGCDKARAITRLLAEPPFAGRRPVFIGDDVTDEPALVKASELGGLALSVGYLLPGADAAFADPAAVRAALIAAVREMSA